jgi:hypothetical protein
MSKPLTAVLLSTAALSAAHADTTVFSTSVQLQAMLNYHDYSTTETWNSADAPYTGPTTAELLAETVVANTDVAINFNRQWGKAFAAPGILRADAYASIFAGDGVTSAHAAAKAGTTGSFIIDSPGRTGQAGWATISVTFSGGRLYSLITEPTPTAPAVGSSWLILDVSVGNSPAAHTAVTTDFARPWSNAFGRVVRRLATRPTCQRRPVCFSAPRCGFPSCLALRRRSRRV